MALEDITGGVTLDTVTQALPTIFTIIWIVVIGLVILLILAVIIWLLKFNVLAVIEEKLEHGTYVYTKKGRLGYDRKDKAKTVEKIFIIGQQGGWPLMPPTYVSDPQMRQKWYRSLYGITKRGKKAIRVLKDGNNYTVVPWANSEAVDYLRISKPVRVQWAANMLREGMEMFKDEPSFWQQYGSYVMLGGTLIVIMIIFIMLFQKFDHLDGVSSAINNYAQSLSELTKAMRELNVQTIN